jgi:DUF1680 family protein
MKMTVSQGIRSTPTDPGRGRLRPLGLDEVQITGGFWAAKQKVNAAASLDHIEHWMEREGWIANFDLAAAGHPAELRRGREFSDSEVYKLIEALAWEIGRSNDPGLEQRLRSLVARVGAAQKPDGYLNTQFGRPGQAARWSDLEWGHELYCLGHLFQAAVARARTRPDADDGLLQIACRAADLVCTVFADVGICGHPVIEPALVELYRVTGEQRYLTQAERFIERRGQGSLRDIEWGRIYYQDDVPVRKATVLRGHAVRAGYLSAGAVDVAVESQDDELLEALATQWSNTVARRTYLTGGQGSHYQNEAFGDDWVLPPDRAYSETCAAVGSVMFTWRLLLALGGPQYADLIERTLYNVVATSPSAEGTAFYYANTLHQRRPGSTPSPDEPSPRASSSRRAPWFAVSCCPPNVARTLAGLAAYVASVDDDGLQLHQYAAARISTALPDGRRIALDVETNYPQDGVIRVEIRQTPAEEWTLTLRVPAWAEGAKVFVHPVSGPASTRPVSPGAVTVTRAFETGDVVELQLPIVPRFTSADPRIDAVRGCIAVERGPEVLCLESVDLIRSAHGGRADGKASETLILDDETGDRGGPAGDIGLIAVDTSVAPREAEGRVVVRLRLAAGYSRRAWPYSSPAVQALDVVNQSAADGINEPTAKPAHGVHNDAAADGWLDVPLIAYHDWANRGPSTMRVWIPRYSDTPTP